MRTLKANARVLGLHVGDTFQSDDKFYDDFVKGGFLSVVKGETDEPEEPVEPPVGEPEAPAPTEEAADAEEPVVVVEAPARSRKRGGADGVSNGE